MAVSTDYTGRTIDLLIFQGVKASGKQPIETAFGLDEGGYICTGVQKVAQTWLTLFMTEQGTVLNKPTRGSTFFTALRFGRIRVEDDVTAEFTLAAEQVRQTMDLDAAAAGDLPDDERLDEANLLDFTLDRMAGFLYLKVRILTIAGDSRDIILPVSVTIV
jgi:hypothetical protein